MVRKCIIIYKINFIFSLNFNFKYYKKIIFVDFLHLQDSLWESMVSILPIPRKRRKTWIDVPASGSVYESLKDFEQFLCEAKIKFPNIIDGDLISKVLFL